MNGAHWHLLLNHLPVISNIVGVLILTAGVILKNKTVKQTSLAVLVFAGLTAVPAYLTGEGAEEVVEKLPGVTERMLKDHETLGEEFFIFSALLALIALTAFILDWIRSEKAGILYPVVLVAGLCLCIFAQRLGTSGGQVRHTEIRSAAQAGGNEPVQKSNPERDND